jgi:hypothetical protein
LIGSALLLEVPSAQWLEELSERFSFEGADVPERLVGAYRNAGYLTLDQVAMIVHWKTAGRQTKRFRSENDDASVRLVTGFAARAADELSDKPDVAASVLTSLRAVHYPTASAVLVAWNPQSYGILDVRAWSALHRLTGDKTFDRGSRTLFTAMEFRLYTLLVRAWSGRTGLPARTIDKALWQFDKERGQE